MAGLIECGACGAIELGRLLSSLVRNILNCNQLNGT